MVFGVMDRKWASRACARRVVTRKRVAVVSGIKCFKAKSILTETPCPDLWKLLVIICQQPKLPLFVEIFGKAGIC